MTVKERLRDLISMLPEDDAERLLKTIEDGRHESPSDVLSLPSRESDPTLTLFEKWREEDAKMTPEEAEEERRLWEAFEAGVNETRRELGMRIL